MSNRRNDAGAYGVSYINDNLARRPERAQPYHAPEHEPYTAPKKETRKREQQKKQHKRSERGLSASFGFAFSLLMALCVMVIFFSLVKYISLHIEAVQKEKQIASLRKELSTAIMENDNYEMAINSTIDYDYIYQVATQELGMVYASKKQIITYKHKETEYVEQYKDVD